MADRSKEGAADEASSLPVSPFPTLGVSLAVAARAVAGSPSILATALLSLLLSWAAFSLFGAEPGPAALAVLVSVLPVPIIFLDVSLAIPGDASVVDSLATVAALALLRGVTFGALCLLILQVLREGRASVAVVAKALPRTAAVVAGLYALQFGLTAAGYQVLNLLLPPLATLAIPGGLYFLGFSPVIAVAEGHAPAQSLRRAARAARLPGTRHLTLVMAYFLVVYYAALSAPFPPATPVTPSLAAWAYGSALTVLHVTFLAALAYRWLAVRDEVPEGTPPRR